MVIEHVDFVVRVELYSNHHLDFLETMVLYNYYYQFVF